MPFCKFCKKWIDKGTGKRAKEFCNDTCRSNFWYAKNKKGKTVEKDEKSESKIAFVKTTPESYDAPKLENYTQDEPLSFDKLREQVIPKQYQPISLPELMAKYFEAKRDCQNAQEWQELSKSIDADERLNKQSKIILKTTNQ